MTANPDSMDGVLLKGAKAIPGAPRALEMLDERRVPWILMTNGGGMSEEQRAELLTGELGMYVDVEQIVQSHTPTKAIPSKEDMVVLVVGGIRDHIRAVAQGYGFKKVLITADYVKTNPAISPFRNRETEEFGHYVEGIEDVKVDKILVFNDPRDLWTDIQVLSDVFKRNPQTEVIFSNNDWLWANEYPQPRYGQGLFRFLLEQLHQEEFGKPLQGTVLGKPTTRAYDYADAVLKTRARSIGANSPKDIFMVGDNPASDIVGGYRYGWNTALVESGVYRRGDPLPCWPTVVGADVLSVVAAGLKVLNL